MVTKEEWIKLTNCSKHEEITKCLEELVSIDQNSHALSKTSQQGKLSLIRKNLENFILETINWENENAYIRPDNIRN